MQCDHTPGFGHSGLILSPAWNLRSLPLSLFLNTFRLVKIRKLARSLNTRRVLLVLNRRTNR